MKLHNRFTLVTVMVILALGPTAWASHIPGHNDGDPIFPVPIPGQEFYSGDSSIVFVTAIGPPGGSVITNTEFDITYFSDGTTAASDIVIEVGYLSESGPLDFEVTGADLGFGSGPGVFSGSFSTEALNGVAVESFFFPPYSIVDLTLGTTSGGGVVEGTAYFVDSFINFAIPEPGSAALLLCGGALALQRRRARRLA